LLGPLEVFAWVNTELAQGRASAARIAAVFAAEPAVVGGDAPLPSPLRGALRLRGVRLDGLDGVDLDLPAGQLTGIAVTDPAYARALLRCLGRDADPESGHVELDGVALTSLAPEELRRAVLVAAHDAALFEGTLGANIAVSATTSGSASTADPDSASSASPEPALDAETLRAMAASRADEVARSLPYGEATDVGEGGRSLSGGQRQRVLLARALRAGRPTLVVHDPTTAVDAVTEARIAEGIRDFRQGRTTVLVTNSPALLAVADRVILLDGGRVGAQGTHAELVRTDDTYRTAVLT
jgi:putative ABC transport system ATP-binding protein